MAMCKTCNGDGYHYYPGFGAFDCRPCVGTGKVPADPELGPSEDEQRFSAQLAADHAAIQASPEATAKPWVVDLPDDEGLPTIWAWNLIMKCRPD